MMCMLGFGKQAGPLQPCAKCPHYTEDPTERRPDPSSIDCFTEKVLQGIQHYGAQVINLEILPEKNRKMKLQTDEIMNEYISMIDPRGVLTDAELSSLKATTYHFICQLFE
ncbi:hypothetical protein QR680_014400 [Steinernema hermaphroditum]|uniref:Uncharacterized protein n=1 Tax=Steinernema hermaphroditum TaxID=289476 RepID=A0AA39M403_9BILA|nr:hypothetical protein QR680_014400 [Steinernema hermaphroditum]